MMMLIRFFLCLLEESNKKHPFPCPTTYRTALTHYLDITNPPRTNVLFELAQYATDPKDQDTLRKMASASPEGKVGIPDGPRTSDPSPLAD
jgi:sulfite reductase alpha subunit-like flavoprotein